MTKMKIQVCTNVQTRSQDRIFYVTIYVGNVYFLGEAHESDSCTIHNVQYWQHCNIAINQSIILIPHQNKCVNMLAVLIWCGHIPLRRHKLCRRI